MDEQAKLLFDEIFKNVPFLRKLILDKIEEEKKPLQAEVDGLQASVDELTLAMLFGGM